jgi:DNA invertase Pin-like site-specific DNA recombinase
LKKMTADNSQEGSIWERLEKGRQKKAALGGYAGYGSPPFGQISLNGELVDDPREQTVIQLIQEQHELGKSLQQIADWLNEKSYTTKRGQQWKRISVKRVIDRFHSRSPGLSEVEMYIGGD